MNWYILYGLTQKIDTLSTQLNKDKRIYAFIPQLEYFRRDKKVIALKPMFPGYIFVKTSLNQEDFDLLISENKVSKNGLIKQLKYKGTSALRKEEIALLGKLLDDDKILRMSYANLDSQKKAKVYKGPLCYFENNIVKVDKHNQLAYLNIQFMNRNIQAGLVIKARYEI